MLNTPFAPWPSFTPEEADAVRDVVLSNKVNYWTGTETRQFEREFADWCGTKHAVALANGTVALDVALKALDVGPVDEVIVTPRTFLASVSCVVNAGATPVFADVDADSGNLSAETIRKVLSARTKAVICVHLAGWPCDMDPIMDLAREHGFYVIEDCAQAHGAQYKGRNVGSIGHIGAWSFCQDKIVTTGGEGGMVTTDNAEWWSRMWSFKDHGKSYDAVYNRQHPPGFRWLHESFGTNWRMLEMQAVIGRIQMRRLPDWTAARTHHALRVADALRPFSGNGGLIRLPEMSPGDNGSRHAYYKFYCYIRPENLAEGWTRSKILEEINRKGVPAYEGSCSEVYLEKAFDNTGWRPEHRLPTARVLGETSMMFLVHPTLTEENIQATCRTIHEVLSQAAATGSRAA